MVSYHVLTRIGFSEKEARLYLTCLELGPATVLTISRKAQVPRGSCYDLLEEMFEKAYVSKIMQKNHVVFTATDPEALLRRTQRSVRRLELALPELKGLFHQTARPKVRYFEGIEGLKRVYEDTLSATTEILNYTNSAQVRLYWPEYDEQYIKQRIKKKISLKCIAPDDLAGRLVKKMDSKCLRKTRLLSAKKFSFTNEINIYDDKVAITSFHGELIGILIESKAIADTQRDIFKMAWAFAATEE